MKELKNERLKKIAEQCGLYIAYDNKGVTTKEIEFFAELIVRECAGIAQKYMSRWPEDHKLTKRIKEHFGVIE